MTLDRITPRLRSRTALRGSAAGVTALGLVLVATPAPGVDREGVKPPGACTPLHALPALPDAPVQVWVDLCPLPPALGASTPQARPDPAQVTQRQDELMQRMRPLGAVEIGRVRLVRQAIAVEVPARQLNALRALEGICGVSPVRHVQRPPPEAKR